VLPPPPQDVFVSRQIVNLVKKLDTVGKISGLFHYSIVVADCVVIVGIAFIVLLFIIINYVDCRHYRRIELSLIYTILYLLVITDELFTLNSDSKFNFW